MSRNVLAEMMTGERESEGEAGLARMTEEKWRAVAAMVATMREGKVSANELKKVVAYVRWWRNRHEGEIGEHLFEYLQVLISDGDAYSKSAVGYREAIERGCRESLAAYVQDTQSVVQILGWAARLV